MKKFAAISFIAVFATVSLFAQARTSSRRAIEASLEAFDASAHQFGLTDPARELRVRNTNTDERGVTHVRFEQNYRGIPVFEGEAISHVDPDGNVEITNALRAVRINTTPRIDASAAIAKVIEQVNPQGPYDVPTARLEILPRGERASANHLVWHVTMYVDNEVDNPAQWEKFVDARTGDVVFEFNAIETAASSGTGKTMYLGDVQVATNSTGTTFELRDMTRGGGNYTVDMGNKQGGNGSIVTRTNNIFGNNLKDNSDRATAAADAHYGIQMTWDFYGSIGRPGGIDGHNKQTYNRVHYGRNYQNAYWSDSCFCMTYGDGGSTFYPLVSLDVAGHEMSHGVMSREANLTYSGESGGLNEANSDMMGTMVEYFANAPQDTPDWWIGERIYKSNWSTGTYVQTKALRYMDNPHKDGTSPACWSSTLGSLDVHYSSGPANHMFYLLASDGAHTSACNGSSVTGLGRAAATRIWYTAVRDYMTPSTNYAGAKAACLKAAANSTETAAVNAAFAAINVP